MISLCVCTHNPRRDLLSRCLEALRHQHPPAAGLELVIIDNQSNLPLHATELGLANFPFPARIAREKRLGLTQARLRALQETRGDPLVFADDDNLFCPEYALETERFFDANSRVGAASGRSVAEFEAEPPAWCDRTLQLALALRNLGDQPQMMSGVVAPLGAGLAVRRAAFLQAIQEPFILGDRCGVQLSSGGDSELCHRLRLFGWELWYAPKLRLTHVIPPPRVAVDYYDRLHLGFGRDWPLLEFYWLPARHARRARYLWRTICLRVRAMRRRPAPGLPGSPEDARKRFQNRFDRGMAETLWNLAVGPPLWSRVERLKALAQDNARIP